jgi:hypothetical protein
LRRDDVDDHRGGAGAGRDQLASACVQGAVSALDRFFNASTAKAGATAAVAELESIQEQCTKANQ